MQALALVRAAAAHANKACGMLDGAVAEALERAAVELAEDPAPRWGRTVWQDGGGAGVAYPLDCAIIAQASRFTRIGGGPVRLNQCVDAFQTAAHVAALQVVAELDGALDQLATLLEHKAAAWVSLIKTGRTHLQDAAPITLGQEVTGYLQQVRNGRSRLRLAAEGLRRLPLGRGCLGTGAGVPPAFAGLAIERLAELTRLPLQPSHDALADLAGPGALAFVHAALAGLAASLFKIASDVTLLSSGPVAGFNELRPSETGLLCSALPGKTNPDAAETLAQVSVHVIGADTAVAFATSQGQFEGNAYLPLLAFNLLKSTSLLAESIVVFAQQGVAGLEPRRDVIAQNVANSVMLVTALTPHIGYEAAAEIARDAYGRNISLREAALASGRVDAATYDRLIRPERMLGPDGG